MKRWADTAPTLVPAYADGSAAINAPPSHKPFSRVTFHALQPEPPKDVKDPIPQPIIYMPARQR